jgi:hypothetical protein
MRSSMSEREHNFKCPACDEEGVITLPDHFLTFGCLGDCGATFAKYQGQTGWSIRCVVEPVFAKSQA